MLKDFLEKIKVKGSKRIVENSVIFIILLVILIIVINSIYETEEKVENVPVTIITENDVTDTLEKKLEKILSLIDGAGNVRVMISYLSSEEKVPIYDYSENNTTTEEKDREGGTRKTESKNAEQKIVFEESGNNKQPFVRQVNTPKIIGVIVVADGATSAKVKENIINAVSAVVDVPVHRIQVFVKKK